jgi:Kef-type K+ transport system membrane component KefB
VNTALFGLLTIISLAMALVSAALASVYVKRLADRPTTPISEEVGSSRVVVKKLRKREPMSDDELDYARRIVSDRSNPLALCVPGTLFCLGCFYVFGSLQHLHGATPSLRTFLGVIPMLTSTNLALRLLSSARLKRRLRQAT